MLEAASYKELLRRLHSVNVVVPLRSEGRVSEHTETYSIIRLLGSLPAATLHYPLHLEKRERPDFFLQMHEFKVGIEHTEAVPENKAHADFLREKGWGPNSHGLQHARVGEARKSARQLIAEIEENEPGSPWIGDSVEREWAEAIAHFVNLKLEKSSELGFVRFDYNWLLIYDNWPAPGLQHQIAIPHLKSALATVDPWLVFSAIFILDERILIEITDTGDSQYEVNHCR